ncbi:hypothetical protein EB796_018704 [Bugula neritina]|uniref:Uncharacterized protein n=1 Tax=Bugula neritina TaxID=10212 RepID=A0A7J7JAB1_BUGNE|nr:hypothetical protein EB796_018704 [Bugula neritina]
MCSLLLNTLNYCIRATTVKSSLCNSLIVQKMVLKLILFLYELSNEEPTYLTCAFLSLKSRQYQIDKARTDSVTVNISCMADDSSLQLLPVHRFSHQINRISQYPFKLFNLTKVFFG